MTENQFDVMVMRNAIWVEPYRKCPFTKWDVIEKWDLAKKQYLLEVKYQDIKIQQINLFKLMKISDSDIYAKEFYNLDGELVKIYKELKDIDYEKTENATYCPLIDYVENSY